MGKLRTLLLSIVCIILALLLFRDSILLSVGNFLIVAEAEVQPADLTHVLGGSRDRVPYGVQLHSQGYSRQIFFTGRGPVETGSATYASNVEYAQEYALANRLQLDGILRSESLANTTFDEAVELKQILDRRDDIQSVIIVSVPYHMRRVRWTFRRVVGQRATLQFVPVPFEAAQQKPQWWKDPSSRQFVRDEYLKILFYRVRYQFLSEASTNNRPFVEE